MKNVENIITSEFLDSFHYPCNNQAGNFIEFKISIRRTSITEYITFKIFWKIVFKSREKLWNMYNNEI